jgi:antitoxin component HigA of HigAB toxin-antitoxin module
MKIKSFKSHLADRLSKDDIADIERAAKIEHDSLRTLQQDISKALTDYMSKNDIGFNDLVRKIGKSPTQVSNIIKGKANLTLSTVAQLYSFMGRTAHIVAERV